MLTCELCDDKRSFSSVSNLNKHIGSKHKSSNSKLFFCELCNDKPSFTYRSNLNRHIAVKHGLSNSKLYPCVLCKEKPRYSSKFGLRRHIASKHGISSTSCECAECGMQYTRKETLRRHIIINHADRVDVNLPSFECAHCSKTVWRKSDLRSHISTVHSDTNVKEEINNNIFECPRCLSVFDTKKNLSRHVQKIHLTGKPKLKKSRLKCLECSQVYCAMKALNQHYVKIHGIVLNYENLEFDNVQSFERWFRNHQRQTLTAFCIRDTNKKKTIKRLICHRSGHVRSLLTENTRKRHLKSSGYKRLGGICPAEIQLHIREDSTCFIKYQKTHVGHNIGDKSELGRLYLMDEEKKMIAAKIKSGIPLAQILNNERANKDLSRLRLLSRTDVRNIATSHNVSFENREYTQSGCDFIDVEAKIAELKNDVVFYKRQSEENSQYDKLEKEDFVLVVITSVQETYLRTYGHKIIFFDTIYGTNRFTFSLHTLMVLDSDCQGLPAAFLISNREDEYVVDIFLACVRDRVGILEPQTLLTDMQSAHYKSWVKIMKKPQYFLYCTWHIRERWRKNVCKISNREKRENTMDKLISMAHELDPIKFENDLNSFLFMKDKDLEDFQEYFKETYYHNTQRWAYCYRTMAGININMNLKSFHQTLKYSIAGGHKLLTLTQCLSYFLKYLALLETNILEKNVRGRVSNKLCILRNRHRLALKQYEENASSKVIIDNTDTFLVQSFEQTEHFYTVTKCVSKECERKNEIEKEFERKSCRLLCESCNLCFHDFTCTCEDSSIRTNMCKHIHLVGLYCKNLLLELDAASSQCLPNENNLAKDKSNDNDSTENTRTSNTDDRLADVTSRKNGNRKRKVVNKK